MKDDDQKMLYESLEEHQDRGPNHKEGSTGGPGGLTVTEPAAPHDSVQDGQMLSGKRSVSPRPHHEIPGINIHQQRPPNVGPEPPQPTPSSPQSQADDHRFRSSPVQFYHTHSHGHGGPYRMVSSNPQGNRFYQGAGYRGPPQFRMRPSLHAEYQQQQQYQGDKSSPSRKVSTDYNRSHARPLDVLPSAADNLKAGSCTCKKSR